MKRWTRALVATGAAVLVTLAVGGGVARASWPPYGGGIVDTTPVSNDGSIPFQCRLTNSSSPAVWHIRCNIGIANVQGMQVPWCTSSCASTTTRHMPCDPATNGGGVVCYRNAFSPGLRTSGFTEYQLRFCIGAAYTSDGGTCPSPGVELITSVASYASNVSSSAHPAAFTTPELWCGEGMACARNYSDQCSRITWSGPAASTPWLPDRTIEITASWTGGNVPHSLWFYWPGTVLHRFWSDPDGKPRSDGGQGAVEITLPEGSVTIPRFYLQLQEAVEWSTGSRPAPSWMNDLTETVTLRMPARAADTFTAGNLRIACVFTQTSGPPLMSIKNWDGSTPSTANPIRSCDRLSIGRAVNFEGDNLDVSFHAEFGADVGPVDIEVWDHTNSVWVMFLDDHTFPGVVTNVNTQVHFDVPKYGADAPYNVRFRCTDEVGPLTGGALDGGPEWAGLAGDSGGCMSAAGLTVAPTSWVPGLVHIGICALDAAVVPSSESVDGLVRAGETLAGRAPVSYVVEVGTSLNGVFADAPGQVISHRNDCLTFVDGLSSLFDSTTDSYDGCAAQLDGSSLSNLRMIAGVVAWFVIAWVFWQTTRRLVSQ